MLSKIKETSLKTRISTLNLEKSNRIEYVAKMSYNLNLSKFKSIILNASKFIVIKLGESLIYFYKWVKTIIFNFKE